MLNEIGSIKILVRMEETLRGSVPSLVNYFLWTNSGEQGWGP